jgi:nitroreductase
MKSLFIKLSSFCLFFSTSISAAESSVAEIFNKRFSGRAYDANKLVSKEQLVRLAQAARTAPSSYNEQPWRFIFLDRASQGQAYEKAYNCLVEFNQNWVKGAPVLVVIAACHTSAGRDKKNLWAEYDTGAAAFGLMLQATQEGLMTHQMGGFDREKLRKEFAIPEECIPMAVMTIGYAAATEKQPEKKERLALQNNFFSGSWNQPLKIN